MFVILLRANFKFRNPSTCSKGAMKRAGKVCGDSQDMKFPGTFTANPYWPTEGRIPNLCIRENLNEAAGAVFLVWQEST